MKKLLLVSLCFLFYSMQIFAQNRTVTGTVTAKDDGLPLPGVSVKVTGTTIGTQTSSSGAFSLSVPTSAKTLTFSFIGYEDQQVSIGSGPVNVALVVGSKQLSEVVVVGYTTTTKQSYTGSAKLVTGEELNKKNVPNVAQALAGEVAGVRVVNSSGQPGSVPAIRIRGFGSVNGNRDPLYVIDGVPYSTTSNATNTIGGNSSSTNALNSINPDDIESIVTLKDAVATAQYGSRGSAGVVEIRTKSGKNKKSFIEADGQYGTNAALIPRYSVITSPEQYVGLSWEALYNQGLGLATPTPDPVAYANARIFSTAGLPPTYNIWNSTAANLVDPATRTVRAGITRKYDPESWKYYAFQKAQRVETNLRLGGGTDKSGYYMSLGYLNDKGYSIASDYRRLTGRLNLNHQVAPWLSSAMNMSFSYSNQNQGGQTSDSGSIFWFVDNIPPIYGLFLRDASGNLVPDPIFGGSQYDYGATGRKFGSLTNSIADTKYNTNRNDRYDYNGNVMLNATILPGLTFENNFGVQYYNLANVQLTNKFYGSAASTHGSIYLQRTDQTNYNLLDLLRYKKKIGDNSFEVYAAHEISSNKFGYLNAFKQNLVSNDIETLDNAVVSSPSSSRTQGYEIESYHGQVLYNYKEKYYVSGTIRTDGSSRFLPGHQWGTFGSGGVAWVISSEDFMKSQSLISFLKLRASYGLIGDQSSIPLYTPFTTQPISNVNDEPGFGVLTIGNPNITWESSKIAEVGLDFTIGKYLDGTLSYYVKNATNQIFDRKTPISTGTANIKVNDGGLRNSAFEFDLTGHILKGKNYFLDLGVNGEVLKNKITAMPLDPQTLQQQVINQVGNYGYSVGHSIYDFYVKKFVGVNPTNGNSTWDTYWVDKNGDGIPQTGTIEAGGTGEYIANLAAFPAYVASHQTVTGINKPIQETTTQLYTNASYQYTGQSAVPAVRGAFNLSGGYHGVSLSVQVLYSLGGYGYDSEYAGLMADGLVGNNNWSTDILRRWQKPGDITDVPRLSNAQNLNVASASDRFITKADYLALNNVRLGYEFPKSILSKIGIPGLSLWVSGDNLWLATKRKGFNPASAEDGASSIYRYSPLSTFSAGVKLKL